ncbi:MAG: ferrous iron transport protein B [Acidobacteriota bacterium]
MNKEKIPKIVLIGQPNSGKSTLFNSIAGFKSKVSNFPGTTVKFTYSVVNIKGRLFEIVDLPGTYSLHPSDRAEEEVIKYLLYNDIDLIVDVIDASVLSRSLDLTLELKELKVPFVIALNLIDDAERKGILIDYKKLEEKIGAPVVPTIALYGKGVRELLQKVFETYLFPEKKDFLFFTTHINEMLDKVKKQLNFPNLTQRLRYPKRFFLIELLEGNEVIEKEILSQCKELEDSIVSIREEILSKEGDTFLEIISSQRHNISMKIAESSTSIKHGRKITIDDYIDKFLMHPVFGYVFLLFIFIGFFFFVVKIGSFLEELLIIPFDAVRAVIQESINISILRYVLDGAFQGLGGGIAIVIPYLLPLTFLMSLLEDSGYLSRAAFLMDTFMHKIGLHGKSIPPFILGYGCNVPAVMSTRILESERDRIVTSLLIPFIPCSARITIISAIVAFYLGPFYALGLYIFSIFLIGIIGKILMTLFPSSTPGLTLEIPTYKLPSPKITFQKAFLQIKFFINHALPILIIGSIVLSVFQWINADSLINSIFTPLTSGVLGLPSAVGTTIIFGFFRKELTLIMLLQALGISFNNISDVLNSSQLFTFTIFVTFYIPCLSTFVVMWKELGKRIALISALISTAVATLLGFLSKMAFKYFS